MLMHFLEILIEEGMPVKRYGNLIIAKGIEKYLLHIQIRSDAKSANRAMNLLNVILRLGITRNLSRPSTRRFRSRSGFSWNIKFLGEIGLKMVLEGRFPRQKEDVVFGDCTAAPVVSKRNQIACKARGRELIKQSGKGGHIAGSDGSALQGMCDHLLN
jgi:hypothetical protein